MLVEYGYGSSEYPRDMRFAQTRGYALLHARYRRVRKWGRTIRQVRRRRVLRYRVDGRAGVVQRKRWRLCSLLPRIPQWSIANEHPPSLRAIAPDVACADCYDMWYPGGMLLGPGRENRARHVYLTAIKHRESDDWWDAQAVDN